MTDQQNMPSSGWYPDPEQQGQMRYWDGNRWTEQGFQKPHDPHSYPVGAGFGRLSHAIRVGLVLSVMVLVGEIVLYGWGLSMFDGAVAAGDLDSLNLFDNVNRAMSITRVVLSLSTGICWVFWQFHLARSARPGELQRSAGLHAGAWFIPFANLVMPFQNVRDLWRRFVSTKTSIVTWWWTAFIIAAVLVRFAPSERPAHALHDLHVRVGFMIAAAVIDLAAAALAMEIISRLTAAGLSRSHSPALSPRASPAA